MANYQFSPSPTFGTTYPPFTTWTDGFTNDELDKIITYCDSLTKSEATIGGQNPNDDISATRSSQIAWVHQTEEALWIYDRLAYIIRQLNGQFYKFDMWGFTEELQYTVYSEESRGHYNWHVDSGNQGPPRKLSLVLQLTDPADYEGGDLEILSSSEPSAVLKQRGLITVFPSYILHRVSPVTKGTRRTIVVWACGPAFK